MQRDDANPRDTSIPSEPIDSPRRDEAEGERENESIEGGGITNRPIEEEQREQQELPPRGENKGGAHA